MEIRGSKLSQFGYFLGYNLANIIPIMSKITEIMAWHKMIIKQRKIYEIVKSCKILDIFRAKMMKNGDFLEKCRFLQTNRSAARIVQIR